MKRVLICLILASAVSVEAAVLCSNRAGHIRVREACERVEEEIDLSKLDGPAHERPAVPLVDWDILLRPENPLGLESVATAPDSTLIAVPPCRLVDTRPGFSSASSGVDIGPFADEEIRLYPLQGRCGIPATATAVSINLAIVPGSQSGFASVAPGGEIGEGGPGFASINFVGSGPAVSNSLIVPVNAIRQIEVYAARVADVIIDTNGYFQAKDANTRTWFVPGTGTPTENGVALRAAALEVSSQPSSVHSFLRLGPGVFDLDETKMTLSRPVAVVGAGERTTSITCDCAGDVLRLSGAGSGYSVQKLGVHNTNSTANATGLFANIVTDAEISEVYVTTAGGAGVQAVGPTDLRLSSVTVESTSASVAVSGTTSGLEIRDSRLVSSGREVIAIFSPSDVLVERSTLETLDPIENVVDTGSSGVLTIRHSSLTAPSASYAKGTGGTLVLTQNFIDAGTISFGGTVNCTGTSGPGTFSASACP